MGKCDGNLRAGRVRLLGANVKRVRINNGFVACSQHSDDVSLNAHLDELSRFDKILDRMSSLRIRCAKIGPVVEDMTATRSLDQR